MSSRLFLLVSAGLLLTGCVKSNWPGDTTIDGRNFADTVIEKRFEQASTKNPGTDQYLREIQRAILQNDPGSKIDEIRWISASKAIAVTEVHPSYASLYCALEKNGASWNLITRYLGAVE